MQCAIAASSDPEFAVLERQNDGHNHRTIAKENQRKHKEEKNHSETNDLNMANRRNAAPSSCAASDIRTNRENERALYRNAASAKLSIITAKTLHIYICGCLCVSALSGTRCSLI